MLRALLAAALVASLAGPSSAQNAGRKVAFLVGVGKFKHDLPDLNGAPQKDVSELAKVLRAAGFEVTLLTDADATREAVDRRFRAAIDGGGNPAKAIGKNDVLLVALCTHGFTLPPGPGKPDAPFLAAHDSKPQRPDTMVSLDGLIDAGKGAGASILYLIDACRELTDPNRGATRGIEPTQAQLPKGTAILFSCGRGQVSHQNDRLGHGLFTYAVLKTLRGEGALKDRVTWSGLVFDVENTFASDEFQRMIPAGKPQTPFAAAGELAATDLLRLRKSPPPPPPGGTTDAQVAADAAALRSALERSDLRGEQFLQSLPASRLAAWRAAADKGDPTAQVLVGHCHLFGVGAMKSDAEAFRWYKKAADAGHPAGIHSTAFAYHYGEGVAKNHAESARLWRMAAEAGWAGAATSLGFSYTNGEGVPKDLAEAVRWHRKAVEGGSLNGMNNLGLALRDGLGVAKNEAEGVALIRRAAEAGNARAQTNLGVMIENGSHGVQKDLAAAVEWFRRSDDAGDSSGTAQLGRCYLYGFGVQADQRRGIELYNRAVEAGNELGEYFLGFAYEYGTGVEKNLDRAVDLYRKAAAKGVQDARDALTRLGK